MINNKAQEYVKYLEDKIEEHVTFAKTFINNKMYRAAEEELRCIGAIEEKLAENRLRIKEMI